MSNLEFGEHSSGILMFVPNATVEFTEVILSRGQGLVGLEHLLVKPAFG